MNTSSYLPADRGASTPVYLVRDSLPMRAGDFDDDAPLARGELVHFGAVVFRHWPLLLTVGLAAAALTAVAAYSLPSKFRSTATVLVEPGRPRALTIEDLRQGGEVRAQFQSQVDIAQSRRVVREAVLALKLWEHEAYDPRQPPSSWLAKSRAWVSRTLASMQGKPTPEWTAERLIERTTDALADDVKVEALRTSQAIKLSVDSEDASMAARIANTLADQVIAADRTGRQSMALEVSSMLQERMSDVREQLSRSEQALQAYREQKGLVNVGGSPQTLAATEIATLTERLATARARRAELEGSYRETVKLSEDGYRNLSAVQRDPSAVEARTRLNALTARLAEAEEKLGTAHTTTREIAAQLAQARQTLLQLQRSVVRGVQLDYEAARTAERELEGRLASARNSARDINREEFQLTVLQREVDANRQLYQMFLSREKEMSVAAEVQAAVARIIDPAVPGDSPVWPKRTQLVLLAFLLATTLGAFLLLLRAALDKTLQGGDDAEQRLKLPVLGALPQLMGDNVPRAARMVQEEPGSAFAEAVRTVRTGVVLSDPDHPDKTLLVTSALPGEGKSTVAINLALTLSQTRRTLLIDADLRRAQIGAKLDLAPNAAGVTHLVGGLLPPQDCVHDVEGTNLKVMPAGELPPQPLELLMSRRFEEMLAALRQHFEMIVIDAPPLEAVSDALVLAPRVSGTLLVTRASTTPYPVIRKNVERLRRAGASILGVVLNQVDYAGLRKNAYAGTYGSQNRWQASVLPVDAPGAASTSQAAAGSEARAT